MRRYLWIITLVLVLVMPLLAACGGDDSDDEPEEADATEQVDAATPTGNAQAATTPAPQTAAEPTAEPTEADDDTDTSSGDNVLRVHQRFYPSIIDPQQSGFTEDIAILLLNYEGLTRLDENLETVPAAAESWEYNADATQITFTLRDGLTYSDGSALVAERFRYAVERTCDPNVAGVYQSILFVVAGCAELAETDPTDQAAYDAAIAALGVQAPDDSTLVVELVQPAPYFHTVASLWVFFPAKQELIEEGGDTWWQQPELQIGNGPFQLERVEQDQLVTLHANESYWEGRPALDGFEYIYQPDSTVALEAYRAGQIDIYRPDPSQFDAVESDDTLSEELVSFPNAATNYLSFNLTVEPFDDPKVREAFAYAFDRETFCTEIRSGDCSPTLSLIPEGVPGAIESDAFAFDPDAATQALADSTYGGPDDLPEITLTYVNDDPAEQPRVEWIAGQFRDVLGVEVTLEGMESTAWVETLYDPATRPQMTTLGWIGDYPDPQNWLSTLFTCEGVESSSGYCNEEFDALTDQADSELDEATRMDLYAQAAELLISEQPVIFLNNSLSFFLVKPEVSGYATTAGDIEWPGQRASMLTITTDR